ncbi:hypothetical protein [Cellulosimicrobium aquatile]|uniref:hypothetical protein n=1 Tax=Cellulosimicrobium aquatile TaxID=1612203 RepID=UPI001459A320|nr:hypothetical protein [Cellulosimicrobium aquatile]NMF28892.1 hypothetical protein [Cellulosimicrobium aquatile]
MPTQNWTEPAWCSQCQQNVDVYWTRISQKNASGETVIDVTTGYDDRNHEFTG